jgi:uncharacterized protein (UPF0276 family)
MEAMDERGATRKWRPDRVGLGWRPTLAAGILGNLDRIDVLEVIADDYLDAGAAARGGLETLARQAPLYLHGVGMGLASARPVEEARLTRMARLVEAVRPIGWSEHLAFVRGGGHEIGHLAAPPRTEATVAGTLANLARARAVVGAAPLVENVATLVEPPGSTLDEARWLGAIAAGAGTRLLLDLHNLHTNAHNFGFDPLTLLETVDLSKVGVVHLGGGRLVDAADGRARVLDDHLHAVPETVFALLTELGARAPGPLDVIVERDGKYPPMAVLLGELDRARMALAVGRARRDDLQRGRF